MKTHLEDEFWKLMGKEAPCSCDGCQTALKMFLSGAVAHECVVNRAVLTGNAHHVAKVLDEMVAEMVAAGLAASRRRAGSSGATH